jgi:hypothetical protein
VQSEQDFEIIIVDDCSVDDTPSFCADVLLMDKRIQVIRLEKNSGTAEANNAGIRASSGEYITIMSADDMRKPLSLEKLLEACKANPHHFAYDDMIVYVNGHDHKIWRFPEYDFDTLLVKNTIHTGIMFERKAFEDTGGYPKEFRDGREDWAMNILLGTKGYCGVHVNYAGYVYRREGQNRTLTNNSLEYNMHFSEMIRKRFAEMYNGRYEMGCCGSRTSVNRMNRPAVNIPQALAGAEGVTALEYQGGNYGTVSYFGPVTGVGYKFDAGVNIRKTVDNRDLHTDKGTGLLDMREHTKAIFKIAPEDATLAPAPAAIQEPVPVPVSVPEPVTEETPWSVLLDKDNPNLSKLIESGHLTVESVKAYATVAEASEKTGVAKADLKALVRLANGA